MKWENWDKILTILEIKQRYTPVIQELFTILRDSKSN
jgi:hypothetical protein